MHGTIEEANSSDHRGRSYIIRVVKTGRLITQDMRYIGSTLVTTEQYLLVQVKRTTGWLEDISMQTV